MGLHRLTGITLGTPDPEGSAQFFRSFGLTETAPGRFATRDGGEQLVLEPAAHRGLRRLGVGVEDPDDLDRVQHRAAAAGVDHQRVDPGTLAVVDPVSRVRFELTVAAPLVVDPVASAPVNRPGHVARVDRPADVILRDRPVQPSNLTHLVLGSTDQPATLRFVTEVIGFQVSDELPGIIAFTRCGEVHHNLAVQAAPCTFVHHVAFEVDDADEVARGGTSMILEDPARDLWGLGRHAIGSNWFWYLREPGGTFVEYTADVDRVASPASYTPKQWQGHEFLYAFGQPPPHAFLEPPDLTELVAAMAAGDD